MAGKMLPRGATIFFESTDHEPKAVGQTGATPSPPNKVTGLDDFELIRVLGKGAFGKVWKVRRKGNGREYAMKVMSKRHFAKENMVDLLKGEQETLARVRHPYLVGLRWAWQTSDRAFLVMDYMPGGELLGHLNRRPQRRFPEAWAKVYAAQVTLALEHLHGLSILYRDMKPDNVVLDGDGNAMLIDFGLALALPPHTKEGGRRYFGKPNYYLSPEMIRGEPFGLEADWWMFGVMLYELLTGTLPWMGALPTEVHRMIISPLYPVRVEQGVCSPAAVDFLTALLCKDLNWRMCTVAAVKAHPWFADISWEKLAAKQVPAPFRPLPSRRTSPPTRSRPSVSAGSRRKVSSCGGSLSPAPTPSSSNLETHWTRGVSSHSLLQPGFQRRPPVSSSRPFSNLFFHRVSIPNCLMPLLRESYASVVALRLHPVCCDC
eukprot:TRINITY_DN2620_c0_g1_i1.p1 TRINITY_DN2620_c0_g1~~TRINITY_DN2620_c0_g1_i1.p1  ORF type:complete len:432 (+),score=79.88 TRINITY_DN2620_c0_g1_i1:1120-2415(+)